MTLPGMSTGSTNHAHHRAVSVSVMTSHNLMVKPGKHAQLAPRGVPLHWVPWLQGECPCTGCHGSKGSALALGAMAPRGVPLHWVPWLQGECPCTGCHGSKGSVLALGAMTPRGVPLHWVPWLQGECPCTGCHAMAAGHVRTCMRQALCMHILSLETTN